MMRLSFKLALFLVSVLIFSHAWAKIEQERAKINLIISGVKGKALENVQSRLESKKKSIYANQPEIVKWNYFRTIDEEVKAALKPYGYFEPSIRTHLSRDKDQWNIKVFINPGRRMRFSSVRVEIIGAGKTDPVFINYLAKVSLKSGDYFNSEEYEKTKEDLQNLASNRGYFQAQFSTNQLVVNLRTYTAQATLIYDTGKRSRIGQTNFSPSPFKLSLLQRYLAYEPNELYNSYLLEKTRQNLASSNFFQSVVVLPQTDQQQNLKTPIGITLYPQDQVTYTFGLGYGTNTKLRGLASMHLNWLNASGHSMKFLARGSQLNSEISASYIIPGRHPPDDSYNFNASIMDLSQVTGKGRNAQASFSYETKIADWQLTASLVNLTEQYSLNNFPVAGENTTTNANVLYPQLLLQRLYAKPDLINPDYGYNISLTAAGGSENFGSKKSFLQSQLNSSFLYTIQYTHTRILTRASVGGVAIDSLVNLPLSMQFYAGGSQSIRGFEYNSIGPGKHVLVGSFELQQRIFGKFYAAGFIDAGNVSDNISGERVKIGAGPALVYLSPIGPVELSVAKNVSSIDLNTGKLNGGWRIHFSLGALI